MVFHPTTRAWTDVIDVCGVVIIANICRIFFWFGARFETRA